MAVGTQGGIILHASAVVTPVGAALFAGSSGAGKSTIAALLAKCAGWPILADDATRVVFRDGAWGAENGALTEGGRLRAPCEVWLAPVAAWFSIRQAPSVSCAPMAAHHACLCMFQAWLEVGGHSSPYDPVRALRAFSVISAMAAGVPALSLDFTLGIDTVRSITDTVKHKRRRGKP